jgi:hypothetical protein
MEGFTPYRLGAGVTHLGKVVMLGGTPVGAARVMAGGCLPERASEGRQTFLPCDNGALSAIKFPRGRELVLQLGHHCRGGN